MELRQVVVEHRREITRKPPGCLKESARRMSMVMGRATVSALNSPRNSRFSVSAMRLSCSEMYRREAIQQYAESIVREFQPEKIILFGSHAYGQPTEDSDVDLMVVMPFRGHALDQAFRIRDRLDHPGFPMDLLVRTPREIGKRQAMGDFFIREILDRGTLLYAGGHS